MSQAENLVTTGKFQYLKPTVESSLYRNGKVLIQRDERGNSSQYTGVDLEEKLLDVNDARQLPSTERRTLHANGFELVKRPFARTDFDFMNHTHVVERYYPDCVDLVQELTGARYVHAFDHNVRSAGGKKSATQIAGGQHVQGPAHVVHGDYTLTSAPTRLDDLARPPTSNDTFRMLTGDNTPLLDKDITSGPLERGERFAIINVWRNISEEPVSTHPLALCDAQSFEPKDLVVFEIHYPQRVGENYFAKYDAEHRWYFYPGMKPSEALLIKQWDSDGPLASSEGKTPDNSSPDAPSTFSFHSAFEDPATPTDAPDRWSIEVRCIVIY